MEYKEYLLSDDWKQKRRQKLLKKRHCAVCSSKKELHVHHLNYKNLFDVEMSDLRVLCKRCHFLAHDLMKEGKIKYKKTNHHSRFVILKTAIHKYLGTKGQSLFYKSKQLPLV